VEQDCKFEEKILETHKAVTGNGRPEEGLLWMTKQNTEFINALKKHSWKIIGALGFIGASSFFNLVISILKDHVTVH
jgi:hypothetical protein